MENHNGNPDPENSLPQEGNNDPGNENAIYIPDPTKIEEDQEGNQYDWYNFFPDAPF